VRLAALDLREISEVVLGGFWAGSWDSGIPVFSPVSHFSGNVVISAEISRIQELDAYRNSWMSLFCIWEWN